MVTWQNWDKFCQRIFIKPVTRKNAVHAISFILNNLRETLPVALLFGFRKRFHTCLDTLRFKDSITPAGHDFLDGGVPEITSAGDCGHRCIVCCTGVFVEHLVSMNLIMDQHVFEAHALNGRLRSSVARRLHRFHRPSLPSTSLYLPFLMEISTSCGLSGYHWSTGASL